MGNEIVSDAQALWKKALENAKLIASTLMVLSALVVGSWTGITSVFQTKAEARVQMERLDLDTSYNKAFRLEEKLNRIEQIEIRRDLSETEQSSKKRYRKDLDRVDQHIDVLEGKIYEDNVKDK